MFLRNVSDRLLDYIRFTSNVHPYEDLNVTARTIARCSEGEGATEIKLAGLPSFFPHLRGPYFSISSLCICGQGCEVTAGLQGGIAQRTN
jgi:hypothetical protein